MVSDVITLVTQTISTDTYGNEVISETEKTVFCEVFSIGQGEFFAAANTELNPEYRFNIFFGDYDGQEIVKYKGVKYAIYRTYRTGDDLELYVERKIGALDTAEAPEEEEDDEH